MGSRNRWKAPRPGAEKPTQPVENVAADESLEADIASAFVEVQAENLAIADEDPAPYIAAMQATLFELNQIWATRQT